MADGIDVGDAILSFLADTSQLDEAATRINQEMPAKLQPASDAATKLGDSLKEAGEKAQQAGDQTTESTTGAKTATEALTESAGEMKDEWIAVAEANLRVAQAAQEQNDAQENLRSAIEAAAKAGDGNTEAMSALALAEARVVAASQNLAAAEVELDASMRATQAAAEDSQLSFSGYNQSLDDASSSTREFGEETHRSRDSVDLLTHLIGVPLPREVKKYVASLDAIAPAMQFAFKAFIVLELIKAIYEAGNALGSFLGDMFIYTAQQKEAYTAQVALNDAIKKQADALKGLKVEYDLLNLEGSRKTVVELDKLTTEIEKNEKELQKAKDTIFFYKTYLEGTAKGAEEAQTKIAELNATLEAQRQQQTNLEKRRGAEEVNEEIVIGQAKVAAAKVVADAQAQLEFQKNRAVLESQNANYAKLVALSSNYQETLYQNEVRGLRERLTVLGKDPIHNEASMRALQAQLTALEAAHLSKRFEQFADFKERLRKQIQSTELPPIELHLDQIIEQSQQAAQKVTDAWQTLGIDGMVPLMEKINETAQAYDFLKNKGVLSATDIQQAEIQLLSMRIELMKMLHADTKDQETQLDRMKEKYQELMGVHTTFMNRQLDLFKLWQKEVPKGAKVWKEMGQVGKDALNDFAGAAESAIASAILSEDSFGHALRKGTAAVLAEVAARSIIYAIFYTAMGFAKLAEMDYVGATNAFTAAAIYGTVGIAAAAAAFVINPKDKAKDAGMGGKTIDDGSQGSNNSRTTAAEPVPVQPVINVQRFASGGLVTRPTLAMIGDSVSGGSQPEPVLPLDDPQAMDMIREAMGGGGQQIVVNVEGLISPDNLSKVVKKISRKVKNGGVRLQSSNSYRTTKRG